MQRFLLTALMVLVLMGSLVYGLVGLTTTLSPEELEDAFSHDAYLYYSLGTFLSREGLHDQAESVLEHGLEMEETPKAWYNLGYLFNEDGEKAQAQTAFEQAIRLDKGYAKPWYGLGILALEQGSWADAGVALDEVVRLTPEDPHAWFDRGLAYTGMFRYEGKDTLQMALGSFEMALTLDPSWAEAEINVEILSRFLE